MCYTYNIPFQSLYSFENCIKTPLSRLKDLSEQTAEATSFNRLFDFKLCKEDFIDRDRLRVSTVRIKHDDLVDRKCYVTLCVCVWYVNVYINMCVCVCVCVDLCAVRAENSQPTDPEEPLAR